MPRWASYRYRSRSTSRTVRSPQCHGLKPCIVTPKAGHLRKLLRNSPSVLSSASFCTQKLRRRRGYCTGRHSRYHCCPFSTSKTNPTSQNRQNLEDPSNPKLRKHWARSLDTNLQQPQHRQSAIVKENVLLRCSVKASGESNMEGVTDKRRAWNLQPEVGGTVRRTVTVTGRGCWWWVGLRRPIRRRGRMDGDKGGLTLVGLSKHMLLVQIFVCQLIKFLKRPIRASSLQPLKTEKGILFAPMEPKLKITIIGSVFKNHIK